MSTLNLGVLRRSTKPDERRQPLHPDHLPDLPAEIRARLVLERGYGEPFGTSDDELRQLGLSLADRSEILATAGVVLLPKPVPSDLEELREGGVLWGWPHCVQQAPMTQVAIDRRLTLIAWEAMFLWKAGEVRDMHLFYRNNEMAGYCGVIHALELVGLDGHYGRPLRAAVLSFGSVSRGALRALRGRGIRDITVYTQRPAWSVRDQATGASYEQMVVTEAGVQVRTRDGGLTPLAKVLSGCDVIVNGILQDTSAPLMFLQQEDVARMKPGALIVDVSCDEGMGFPFARPTSFAQPTFQVGAVTYYAVDHTPTYLWRSATWELSCAVLPYVETVLGGPPAWDRDETISRAIEIRDGVVQNPAILEFQNREADYPHGPSTA